MLWLASSEFLVTLRDRSPIGVVAAEEGVDGGWRDLEEVDRVTRPERTPPAAAFGESGERALSILIP